MKSIEEMTEKELLGEILKEMRSLSQVMRKLKVDLE